MGRRRIGRSFEGAVGARSRFRDRRHRLRAAGDRLSQSLDAADELDLADEFQIPPGQATSLPGDLWLLGDHRLYCGSALEATAYDVLLDGAKAAAVFTDPPYNVKIDGHVCGSGAIKHREFAMASGEMTSDEFERFLAEALRLLGAYADPGAVIYACMDWRHMAAGNAFMTVLARSDVRSPRQTSSNSVNSFGEVFIAATAGQFGAADAEVFEAVSDEDIDRKPMC